MNAYAALALLVVVLIVGAGTGYFVGIANERSVTVASTFASTSTTTLSTAYVFKSRVFAMDVNGTLFYADDVSNDTRVENPGYSYFTNGSVTFDGVKFEMVCPPSYNGCPAKAGVNQTVTLLAGAFRFNMTFPDGASETGGNVIGDLTYVFALSPHSTPRAGILIEYIMYDYPHNFPPYHVFLLVSNPLLPKPTE